MMHVPTYVQSRSTLVRFSMSRLSGVRGSSLRGTGLAGSDSTRSMVCQSDGLSGAAVEFVGRSARVSAGANAEVGALRAPPFGPEAIHDWLDLPSEAVPQFFHHRPSCDRCRGDVARLRVVTERRDRPGEHTLLASYRLSTGRTLRVFFVAVTLPQLRCMTTTSGTRRTTPLAFGELRRPLTIRVAS